MFSNSFHDFALYLFLLYIFYDLSLRFVFKRKIDDRISYLNFLSILMFFCIISSIDHDYILNYPPEEGELKKMKGKQLKCLSRPIRYGDDVIEIIDAEGEAKRFSIVYENVMKACLKSNSKYEEVTAYYFERKSIFENSNVILKLKSESVNVDVYDEFRSGGRGQIFKVGIPCVFILLWAIRKRRYFVNEINKEVQ